MKKLHEFLETMEAKTPAQKTAACVTIFVLFWCIVAIISMLSYLFPVFGIFLLTSGVGIFFLYKYFKKYDEKNKNENPF